MLGLSSVPATAAERQRIRAAVDTDEHTLDTYRSIVDAIIPRTPELAAELGAEHEPGALDAEIERFLVYSFDNFHEIRPEMLTTELAGRLGVDLAESDLLALVGDVVTDLTSVLRNLLSNVGLTTLDGVFGALEGITVDVLDGAADGVEGTVELTVETSNDVINRVSETYPYAELFSVVFDLVALEFLLRGENEEDVDPGNEAFPAGGAFTWLAPRDRLRCLETIEDGGILDELDEALGEVVPTLGILKFGVMAMVGFPMLGYYSEWAAYGETKTDQPTERHLETPVDQITSRQQTGYPGFQPGYAEHMGFELQSFRENDWRDSSGADVDGEDGASSEDDSTSDNDDGVLDEIFDWDGGGLFGGDDL